LELAEDCGWMVAGFFDQNPHVSVPQYAHLGPDGAWAEALVRFPELKVALAVDPPSLKERLIRIYGLGHLAALQSADAFISRHAVVDAGCIIQRGVKIMSGAHVRTACKINVNATVHHDCDVGDYATLAPGSQLLGHVVVERGTFIGAGATILPRLRIGAGSVVGAGAVVTRDIPPKSVVAGVPAKERS